MATNPESMTAAPREAGAVEAALLDLLGQFDQAHDALGVDRSPSAQEAIAKARAALAAGLGGWRTTGEHGWPPYATKVIVWGEEGMGVAAWAGDFWADEHLNSVDVTHWQPLPSPPSSAGTEVES